MTKESPNLKRLVGYMSQMTSSDRPMTTDELANALAMHPTTVWRNLKNNEGELFVKLPGPEPFRWFYIPNPRGQRILDIGNNVPVAEARKRDNELSPNPSTYNPTVVQMKETPRWRYFRGKEKDLNVGEHMTMATNELKALLMNWRTWRPGEANEALQGLEVVTILIEKMLEENK